VAPTRDPTTATSVWNRELNTRCSIHNSLLIISISSSACALCIASTPLLCSSLAPTIAPTPTPPLPPPHPLTPPGAAPFSGTGTDTAPAASQRVRRPQVRRWFEKAGALLVHRRLGPGAGPGCSAAEGRRVGRGRGVSTC